MLRNRTLVLTMVLRNLLPDDSAITRLLIANMKLTGMITRSNTNLSLRKRRLMTKKRILDDLDRGLIMLLAARMIGVLAVNILRNNNILRKILFRKNLIDQRNTTDRADNRADAIINMLSRLMDDVDLLNKNRRDRQEAAILEINNKTIDNQRLNRAPLTNAIDDKIDGINERPDTDRRKNSNTISRTLRPVLKPTNNLNIRRALIRRLLPRINRNLSTLIFNRISNSFKAVKKNLRQLNTNRPNRKIRRTNITNIKNSMMIITRNIGLLNNIMMLVPNLSLLNVGTNLIRSFLIMRRNR